MKNFSFLGLALVGASGVVAAFIPAKKADAKTNGDAINGYRQLTTASNGPTSANFTCTITPDGSVGTPNCSYTVTAVYNSVGEKIQVGSATSILQNTFSVTFAISVATGTATTNG